MKRSLIYIIIAGILWGSSGVFVHFIAPFGFSSLQMTAVRSFVAGLSMLVYLLIQNRKLIQVGLWDLILIAGAAVSFFGTAFSYYVSMQASSVSTAVILMYSSPVMVMAYSVAFMGERLTGKKITSVVMMLVGCALVSGIVGGMAFSPKGVIFGLLAAVSYSAYNVFAKMTMSRGVNAQTATLWCFGLAGILGMSLANPPQIVSLTMQSPLLLVPLLIGLGIFTCVVPYFLYSLALRVLPAGTATSLGIVEPMAATLFSVTLLGESLSLPSICGIVLILSAVFLLSRNID